MEWIKFTPGCLDNYKLEGWSFLLFDPTWIEAKFNVEDCRNYEIISWNGTKWMPLSFLYEANHETTITDNELYKTKFTHYMIIKKPTNPLKD